MRHFAAAADTRAEVREMAKTDYGLDVAADAGNRSIGGAHHSLASGQGDRGGGHQAASRVQINGRAPWSVSE